MKSRTSFNETPIVSLLKFASGGFFEVLFWFCHTGKLRLLPFA